MNSFIGRMPSIEMLRAHILLTAFAVAVSGCGAGQIVEKVFAPDPTSITVSIVAAEDLNPNRDGRPSPLRYHFFELESVAALASSDFFSLFERPDDTLGAAMLTKDTYTIRPGETQLVSRNTNERTKFVGLVAGYQSTGDSTWRVHAPVIANSANAITFALYDNDVRRTGD